MLRGNKGATMHGEHSRRTLLKDLLSAATAGVLLSADHLPGAEPAKATPQPAPAADSEFRRPELLAIFWLGDQVRGKKAPPPEFAWRLDGSLLSRDEIARLEEQTRGFGVPYFNPAQHLRPLVLVLRIDERAKWKQSVQAMVVGPRGRCRGGSYGDSNDDHLAISCVGPFKNELAAWPEHIDIELRTQVAEPEMILRLDEMPKGKIQVDKGVQWSIDPKLGIRRDDTRGFPAAVTWWSTDRNPLNDYDQLMTLKNGQQLKRQMVHPDYEISEVIEPDNPIVSAEFWRRRFRMDRIDRIPTFLERMPK
jgi:hypothetical protein